MTVTEIIVITTFSLIMGIIAYFLLKHAHSKKRIDAIKVGDIVSISPTDKNFIIKEIKEDTFVVECEMFKHLVYLKK